VAAAPGISQAKDCTNCPAQAALSDPAIQSILKFAIEEYDRIFSDDSNLHKAVALLKAYTQVNICLLGSFSS